MKFPDFYPAIIWLMACLVLLCLPGSAFSGGSLIPYFDKWIHLGLFGALDFLWLLPFLLYTPGNRLVLITTTLAVAAFGVLMEFFQLYVIPGRSFEMADILADTGGALAALVFVHTAWGRQAVKKIGPDRNRGRNQN